MGEGWVGTLTRIGVAIVIAVAMYKFFPQAINNFIQTQVPNFLNQFP